MKIDSSADIWLACLQEAPRNVTASMDSRGITAGWESVLPVAGFDPGGCAPLGFYQIDFEKSGDTITILP